MKIKNWNRVAWQSDVHQTKQGRRQNYKHTQCVRLATVIGDLDLLWYQQCHIVATAAKQMNNGIKVKIILLLMVGGI